MFMMHGDSKDAKLQTDRLYTTLQNMYIDIVKLYITLHKYIYIIIIVFKDLPPHKH